MKRLLLCMLMAGSAASYAGCAVHHTQRVPTLTGTPAPAPDSQPAPKPNFVQQVGDSTWNVVSAPARLVTPKKQEPREPVIYEAPTATITRRSYADDDVAPASAPAPATSAATRP